MNRILVTGATGTVGRQVVSQLLPTDSRVRAMTRNPNAARLPAGLKSYAAISPSPKAWMNVSKASMRSSWFGLRGLVRWQPR